MRAAAILGLGSSIRDLKPFQNHHPEITWSLGLPAYGGSDSVLIFGGDGTVHRHLAPLVELGVPVLVVPRGSGNDFARALGIESVQDAVRAWQRFVAGQSTTRSIDLGSIEPLPAGTRSGRNQHVAGHIASKHYFCCVAGAGLDAVVTRLANRLPPWLRAHGGYALSLPVGLARFDPCHVTVLQESAADPDAFTERYSQPALLAAVANAPTYGGGMRIAPRAALDDGLLDVCIVGKLPKFKLLALFPTVYMGRHLGIKQVDYFQVKGVRIQTPSPIDVYADGEYVCQTPVQVSVVPHVLSVILADAGLETMNRREQWPLKPETYNRIGATLSHSLGRGLWQTEKVPAHCCGSSLVEERSSSSSSQYSRWCTSRCTADSERHPLAAPSLTKSP